MWISLPDNFYKILELFFTISENIKKIKIKYQFDLTFNIIGSKYKNKELIMLTSEQEFIISILYFHD